MINMMQGDCMDLMKSKPDNYYDLAIVYPPYGIFRSGQDETFTKNPKHKRKAHKQKSWDFKTPDYDYFKWLFRVSKNQIIWGANYFVKYLDVGTMGWVVWDKGQKGLSMSDCEIAYTSFDKATRIFVLNRSAIAKFGGSIHPTQKPVQLYKWLLTNYAKEGDKILDTHGGSGSICIACHDLKFDLDWIELDKEYYELAKKRYEYHASQLQIF